MYLYRVTSYMVISGQKWSYESYLTGHILHDIVKSRASSKSNQISVLNFKMQLKFHVIFRRLSAGF